MKPNLEDMRVFLEVVEARSFTAAAERLGRTKSAVSQTVTRLEDDLGTRLLYRSTRSLSLTDAGTRFLVHCRDIRTAYDTAIADIKTSEVDPSGMLSLTAPNALCAPVIVPLIGRFVELYPDVGVRLQANDSPMDLIETQIDLAVRVGEPDIQSAKVSKLGVLYESLYASPDFVAARGGPPADLTGITGWDHIANEWQGVPLKYRTADGAAVRIAPRIRCNSLHDILRLAQMGAGVARLPDTAAADSVRNGTLQRLFEVGSAPVHSMHLFERRPPAKVRIFIQMVREKLRSDRHAATGGRRRVG